jgi:hypothetical protein
MPTVSSSRSRFPRAAALALLALPTALAACAAKPSLVGFPAREIESESAEAGVLLEDVRAIEAAIEEVDAAGSRARRPVSRDEVRESMRAILDAHLVLSGEHFDYQDPSQEDPPGRPPIILYPRLVSPAIAEPIEVADANGERDLRWFVPLIFDLDAVYWDDSFRTVWLGWPPERVEYKDPGYHVTLWLVPHGGSQDEPRQAILLDEHLIDPAELSVALDGGAAFRLPDVLPNRAGLALSMPVRTDARPEGMAPGYYDVRLFPRIRPQGIAEGRLAPVVHALIAGDWFGVERELGTLSESIAGAEDPRLREDLGHFVEAIDAYPPTWFGPELDQVRAAAARARDAASDLQGAILRLRGAVRGMLRQNLHPAPVLLEAPHDPAEPFSFIVSADWQYHADMTDVHRFLSLIDPAFLPSVAAGAQHALVATAMQERIRKARFVIAAGDLGDGRGLSSSPGQALVTSLGLAPPMSPYDLEFDDLRDIISRFRIPVFAVPGNHDGFAHYGGFVNAVLTVAGRGLRTSKTIRPVGAAPHLMGELFRRVGSAVPVLFKFLRILEEPFFDGIIEWRFHLGPTQFAFRYRGHSFVGLNSYGIDAKHRDQVGALANNWGGGVERHDVIWFDVMLRRLRGSEPKIGTAPKRQFIFMHQDPRGARPYVHSYEEGGFGAYDAVEAPLNALTFGYFGLGWSSNNPLWLPIITPIASNLPSQLLRGDAEFNQEWMKRGTLHDADCYGARPLVEAINLNLAKGPGGPGVSHVFLGHDDVPVVSQWVDEDQGGRVFRTAHGGDWPGNMWGSLAAMTPLFRTRTVAPPEWGRAMHLRDGRNAVVLRCDDVGQSGSGHGFHLVTVDPSKPPPEDVTVEWIQIP